MGIKEYDIQWRSHEKKKMCTRLIWKENINGLCPIYAFNVYLVFNKNTGTLVDKVKKKLK